MEQQETPEKTAAYWVSEIEKVDKARATWAENAKTIRDRFARDKSVQTKKLGNKARYNILWSNIQTLRPAIFSRLPSIYVERRFQGQDDVGRVAARILQQTAQTQFEEYDSEEIYRAAVQDYLLVGLGQVWPRYEPIKEEAIDPMTGETFEKVVYEKICDDFVMAENFYYDTDCSVWQEVTWAGKKIVGMSRKEAEEKFGFDVVFEMLRHTNADKLSDIRAKIDVYEIWDKVTRKVYWIGDKYPMKLLLVQDDPLNLKGFFPCPRPLMATTNGKTLIPTADYVYYKEQAEMLDTCAAKADTILEMIKVVGVYDGTEDQTLKNVFKKDDGAMIPVKSFGALAEKGGIKGILDFIDISPYVSALTTLTSIVATVKNEIYEITGISDIVRGMSNPVETATAQQIKGNFATMRLDERRKEVQRFFRDLIRTRCELIAEQFGVDMFAMAGGISPSDPDYQLIPQADALLKNEAMRGFRIDIETDSTITVDKEGDKSARLELVSAIIPNLQTMLEVGQRVPEIAPLLGELIMFTLRAFSAGRQLEAMFEQAIDGMVKKAQQEAEQSDKPAEPSPDTVLLAKQRAAESQMDNQTKLQIADQNNKAKLAIEQIKQNAENMRAAVDRQYGVNNIVL